MLDNSTSITHPVEPKLIREAHLWLLAQARGAAPPPLSHSAAQWLEARELLNWVLTETGETTAEISERGRLAVLGKRAS